MVPARKLIFVLFCALACGQKDPDEKGLGVSPEKLDGRFEMLPSARGEVIEFREDGIAEYSSESERQKGLYSLTQQSLRFRFESGDYGVFLRTAFHPKEWRGIYKDEVRILKRVSGAKNLDP